MSGPTPLFRLVLALADDQLVLGHRLSEWCGVAPMLEEDLALANIALDHIGQARALYDLAGAIEGAGRDEDQLAYLREEREYRNLLLVEQPKGDFAFTTARQFVYAAFMRPYWAALAASADERLAAIAAKAEKEAAYHLRHAAEWTIRLGDGTDESRRRMIEALDDVWPYVAELFEMDAAERALAEAGVAVDRGTIRPSFDATVDEVLAEAGLERPKGGFARSGGRAGRHGEHMGHLLAELQYLQRTYPGATW